MPGSTMEFTLHLSASPQHVGAEESLPVGTQESLEKQLDDLRTQIADLQGEVETERQQRNLLEEKFNKVSPLIEDFRLWKKFYMDVDPLLGSRQTILKMSRGN